MTRVTLLILILFSLIAGSCSSRKNSLNHRHLIPEKELVSILTDVYIADGLITIPKIHNWFASLDSLSSYSFIIQKHGYTKETMEKTMKYYFIREPKKLIKIYDQVLGILSRRESLIEKEILLELEGIPNLWTDEDFYFFPDPSASDSSRFDFTLDRTGIYTLNFSATLFPDDQSFNPRITVYSCHPDSIETGKKKYIKTIKYIKDGHPHNYTLIVKVPEKTTLHLRGWFYDFDNHPDSWKQHVSIENITFTFNSTPVV
jgi:hypothetical protein